MTVCLADRLRGGGLVAACGLLLALSLPATASAELWAVQKGDDPRWSRPDFDDSTWPRGAVRSTWREQGLQGYDGVVWFRRVIVLDDEARMAGRKNELALLLGPPAYGGYEAYADGQRIGRSRGWSSALPFGFPEVFRVPRAAIGSDGTVSLALRVRRIGWISDSDSRSAPVSAVLTFGEHRALADRVRADWSKGLVTGRQRNRQRLVSIVRCEDRHHPTRPSHRVSCRKGHRTSIPSSGPSRAKPELAISVRGR